MTLEKCAIILAGRELTICIDSVVKALAWTQFTTAQMRLQNTSTSRDHTGISIDKPNNTILVNGYMASSKSVSEVLLLAGRQTTSQKSARNNGRSNLRALAILGCALFVR